MYIVHITHTAHVNLLKNIIYSYAFRGYKKQYHKCITKYVFPLNPTRKKYIFYNVEPIILRIKFTKLFLYISTLT